MRGRKNQTVFGMRRVVSCLTGLMTAACLLQGVAALPEEAQNSPLPPFHYRLRGQVVDACSNLPLAFAVLQSDEDRQHPAASEGQYSLGLQEGTHFVVARAEGYYYEVQRLVMGPGTHYVNFALEPLTGCPPIVPRQYKAIIVAGGGETLRGQPNALWPATRHLSDLAYTALRLQGLDRRAIRYLSAEMPRDVDEDGVLDTEVVNLATLEQSLTRWARDTEEVLFYFVGHGSEQRLQLNAQETLTAEQLDAWGSTLRAAIPGKLLLVLDACKAGSFLRLGSPRQPVLASTGPQQAAVISNHGYNAFSYYFWSQLALNAQIGPAFRMARQAMSAQTVAAGERQNAQLDADGDGQFTPADYANLDALCLGGCKRLAFLPPVITRLDPERAVWGDEPLTLSADVTSLDPLREAWLEITPPSFQHRDSDTPILDIPRHPLTCDAAQHCQITLAALPEHGRYTFNVYAATTTGLITVPRTLTLERRPGNFYDPDTHRLRLDPVEASGQRYRATLAALDAQQWVVTDLEALGEDTAASADAHYAPQAARLVIRKLYANGAWYQVTLRHAPSASSVLHFRLESITPTQP